MACTTEGTKPLSPGGQHEVTWAGAPPRAKHTTQLALPSTRHTEPSVPMCSCPSLLWGRKQQCSGNHYLGIKCKPKTNNNKSNQHKVGKHCQPSVTLFCLVSCEKSVTCTVQVRYHWVLAVPWNSYQ